MPPAKRYRIVVCRGPECGEQKSSSTLHAEFLAGIRARGLDATVELGWQSCFGRCRQGPNVLVREVRPGESRFLLAVAPVFAGPGAALYSGVTRADVPRILDD